MIAVVVILVIVATIVGLILVFWRHEKFRKKRIVAVAQEFGLSPVAEVDVRFGTELDLFKLDDKHQLYEPVLEGSINGRRALLFDYGEETGSGDNSTTHFSTIAAFAILEQNLPFFRLEKKSFWCRGIEIESKTEFAKRFSVSGKDQAAIRNLFTPALVNVFTSTAIDKQKCSLRGSGNWLLFFRRTLPAEECRKFLIQTSQIAAGFSMLAGSLNEGSCTQERLQQGPEDLNVRSGGA